MRVSLEWFYDNLDNLEYFASNSTHEEDRKPHEQAKEMFLAELRRIDRAEFGITIPPFGKGKS